MTPDPPRSPRDPDSEESPPLLPFSFFYAGLLTVFTCFLYSLVTMIVAPLSGSFLIGHGAGLALAFANAAALAYRRTGGEPVGLFALRTPHSRAWISALLLGPAILLISELDNWLVAALGPVAAPDPPQETPPPEPIALALAVLVGVKPLVTEGFFRGLVFGRLEAIWQDGMQAVIATTLLSWAFATLSVVLLSSGAEAGFDGLAIARLSVHALGAAALLGLLRQCSGSLYPPLLLAALFGVIDVAGARDALGIPGFDDTSASHTPLGWLIPAAALTGVGLRLCLLIPPATDPGDPEQVGPRAE